MQERKCCLHCPGKWVSSQERKEHICNLPTYIKGNLKISSLKKYVAGENERAEKLRKCPMKSVPSSSNSVYDRFAIAKKFHAENLQHQPLPDKVDDLVFKNVRNKLKQIDDKSEEIEKNNGNICTMHPELKSNHKTRTDLQYVSALGCKSPATNMDLAICWEAPIDPCYEPSRPAHIDGSNGGNAPAIFTLVQRENNNSVKYTSPIKRFEAKFCNVNSRSKCDHVKYHNSNVDDMTNACTCAKNNSAVGNTDNCTGNNINGNDLCDELSDVHISNESHKILKEGYSNSHKKLPVHLRNCSPCQCRGDRNKRLRSRSIHSATVSHSSKNMKKNGLPNKLTIPRPRTPYARREFSIDTLTPPFSIIEGCRDADYPEHWRLTSVYQQSYSNPKKFM